MTVTFIEVANPFTETTTEYALIDRGNGEYTSMPKSFYDEQQAEHFTPIVEEPTQ
jgi:hypothetical protein